MTTTTSSDLDDVRVKLTELAASGRVDELIELVITLLGSAQSSNTVLTSRLQMALRALYGRKSEKFSADQLSLLFAGLGDEAPETAQTIVDAPGDVPQPDKPPPAARAKRKRGSSALPASLPREIHDVRVPDAERTCDRCGKEKTGAGFVTSEILEFVPAHFKIIEERREKLACDACGHDSIVVADSEKVMEGGRPGPALLAHIVVSKFQDSLPLYRQCQIYERAGVSIASSTIGDWTAFALEVLEPIATRIISRVLSSFVIGADDTGLRVLDRNDPRGVKKGHIWGYVGDCKLVAFDYTKDWKSDGPAEFLRRFRGFMQGDGYAGFDRALKPDDDDEAAVVPENRRLGCGMHVRRKFEAAAQAGDARGVIAVAYFKKLYEIERSCKDEGLTADARKARRAELSMPILDELFAWVSTLHPKLVPGTPLHAATRYATNQEFFFRRCFDDGRFEIDNGEVERQLRRIALGRKNYLFAGSDAGADRIATASTLLGSAHMNGLDPLAYLTDVITKLQAGWPMARIDELLPDVWAKSPAPAG